jgi:hypothetical protein
MGLRRDARPTKGNIKTRLQRIIETCHSLDHMACRWNPKGRYFMPQRNIIKFSQEVGVEAEELLEVLRRR